MGYFPTILNQSWVVPGQGMWCLEGRMCRNKPVWRWYPVWWG